jgi:hypothetical protein
MTDPSTDLVTAAETGLAILDTPHGLELVADALEDQQSGELLGLLSRATITATGVAAFEVDEEIVKEIDGVVVDSQLTRKYYVKEFDGGNEAPDCSSTDGITGVPQPGVVGPTGDCKNCPFNQFVEGGGKPCRENMQVAVIPKGDLMPILVSVPPASLQSFKAYRFRLLTKAPFRKLTDVVTNLSVEKASTKNRDNINAVRFKVGETLEPEAGQKMADVADQLRPALERQAREDAMKRADYDAAPISPAQAAAAEARAAAGVAAGAEETVPF